MLHRGIEVVVDDRIGREVVDAGVFLGEAGGLLEGIAQGRDPEVGIDEFADSSINIGFRVWVPTKRYHHMRYKINMEIYKALQVAEITIPFPQRDVHLIKPESENE